MTPPALNDMNTPAVTRLDSALVEQTVPPGSLRYYSLLYAEADKRDVLVALHLLEDELAATARSTNHDVAHTRLKWWNDELERLSLGKPAHPATRALAHSQDVLGPELSLLKGLVESAAMDLALVTYADEPELERYFDRAGGALAQLATRWLLAPSAAEPSTLQAAGRLGALIKQVEALRDLRPNSRAGRIHFALTMLDAAGIDTRELSASPWPSRVQDLVRSTQSGLQAAIKETTASFVGPDRAALRPLLVTAGLHLKLLDQIGRHVGATAPVRVELGPFDKLIVSWKAARSARWL